MMFVVDELAGIQRGVDDLLPPGWRAEILGDRLVVNPPSGYEHNRLADRVQRLFLSRLPDHLDATVLGEGVYRDTGHAEYMVPDVVVFKPGQVNQDRLLGRDVELVGEIVSPTNRREADYEHEIVERASRFGIEWVLIVDPVTHTVSWWHESQPVDHGPKWTGEISWSDLNPQQAPRPSLLK